MSTARRSPTPSQRRALLLRRLALCTAVAVASVLIAEYSLRVVLAGGQRWLSGPPNTEVVFHPDPEVMPGVQGPARVAFDSHGLRGDELERGHTPRVLCLGGSTTACDYLDQEEAWPMLLQKALGQRAWIGNAGRSGLTSRGHVLQLEHLLPQLPEIDTVLCLVGVNDLALALEQGADYQPAGLERGDIRAAVVERAFFDRPREFALWPPKRTALFALLDRARRARWARQGALEDLAGENYRERRRIRAASTELLSTAPDLGPALGEYRANLARMAQSAEAHGVRLVFLTQPVLWSAGPTPEQEDLCWYGWIGREPWDGPDAYYSIPVLAAGMQAYNQALRESCASLDLGLVDLALALPNDRSVFYDDCHLNEEGARCVARLVTAWLAENP